MKVAIVERSTVNPENLHNFPHKTGISCERRESTEQHVKEMDKTFNL